jgi:hypothetical protein
MLKEKRKKFCSIFKGAEPNRLEILIQKLFFKFRNIGRKKNYQPTVLMLLITSLIDEFSFSARSLNHPKNFLSTVFEVVCYTL